MAPTACDLRRSRFSILTLGILILLTSIAALAEHHPATTREDVEVIRRGGINMYRYRDTNGQTIVVDRPPAFYFDTQAPVADEEIVEEPNQPKSAPPPPPVPPEPRRPVWWKPAWAVPIGLILASLFRLLWPRISRWRGETPLDRVIRLSGRPVFEDLSLSPDGRHSILADRVVRTPSGLLVAVVAELTGDVRGALDADHWLVGKTPVLNPLKRLEQATNAVAHYALEVPVQGRLVVRGRPKFAMPLPSTVQSAASFAATLEEHAEARVPVRALDGVWRTLMRLPRSNDKVRRPMGTGALAWVRRHPDEAVSGALAVLALVGAVALMMVPAV